jgi:hypothetical protein
MKNRSARGRLEGLVRRVELIAELVEVARGAIRGVERRANPEEGGRGRNLNRHDEGKKG